MKAARLLRSWKLGASTDIVRVARLSEAGVVQEVSAAAYIPVYQPIIGAVPKPAREDYTSRIERGEVWVLETGSSLAGVVVLEPAADHLMLYSVAVHPRHQGQGYGRLLIAFAERRAAAIRLPEVRLYTTTLMEQNLAFYRSCGYSEVGIRPHPTRAGAVIVDMVKSVRERTLMDR